MSWGLWRVYVAGSIGSFEGLGIIKNREKTVKCKNHYILLPSFSLGGVDMWVGGWIDVGVFYKMIA